MARRRLLKATLVLGGLGASMLYRRRAARRRERVDLYYEDGSMLSLPEGSPDAERLLAVARDVLHALR